MNADTEEQIDGLEFIVQARTVSPEVRVSKRGYLIDHEESGPLSSSVRVFFDTAGECFLLYDSQDFAAIT